MTRLGRSVCVPSTCIQAFVHQCDSGEALINSSPTLGYPPPVSLNTHTKTQMHESRNSAAWSPPSKSPAFISLPRCLCRDNLSTRAHPTHQDTSLYYSCVYFFLMRQSALRHPCSEGCLGGAGENRIVNLQSYVNTNVYAKVCGKVWCYPLNHEVTFTAAGPKADGPTCAKRRFLFHLISSEHHASVAAPTP